MNLIFKRILSFFIDLMFFGFLGGILGLLTDKIEVLGLLTEYLFYFILIAFLFRDLYTRNGSLGKSILKLSLLDKSEEKKGYALRKILRNLTNFVWPIEVFFVLVIKSRISDKLLKLEVSEVDKD